MADSSLKSGISSDHDVTEQLDVSEPNHVDACQVESITLVCISVCCSRYVGVDDGHGLCFKCKFGWHLWSHGM